MAKAVDFGGNPRNQEQEQGPGRGEPIKADITEIVMEVKGLE